MLKEKLLTPNQYWILQHQITAFWHGFGISNGLMFLKDDLKEVYTTKSGKFVDQPTKTGKTYIKIPEALMQHILNDYIKCLEDYKSAWDREDEHPDGVDTYAKFVEEDGYHESRKPILKMIELLQD